MSFKWFDGGVNSNRPFRSEKTYRPIKHRESEAGNRAPNPESSGEGCARRWEKRALAVEIARIKTTMEDFDGDFSHRKTIMSELCCNQIAANILVQDLRTLVAFTDPEDGILVHTPDGGVKHPLRNS